MNDIIELQKLDTIIQTLTTRFDASSELHDIVQTLLTDAQNKRKALVLKITGQSPDSQYYATHQLPTIH